MEKTVERFKEIKIPLDWKQLATILDFEAVVPMPLVEGTVRSPTAKALIFRLDEDGKPIASVARWGLLPYWLKSIADARKGPSFVNARSDSLFEKKVWQSTVRARRTCLILCDSFRESRDDPSKLHLTRPPKEHFRFRAERPMLIAGLWRKGWGVESMTMVTTDPCPTVATVHDRMPCVLPDEVCRDWLHAGDTSDEEFLSMLKVYEGELEIMKMVGHNTYDDNQVLEFVEERVDAKDIGLSGQMDLFSGKG